MQHYQDPERQNSENAKLPPEKDLCERTCKDNVWSMLFVSVQFHIEVSPMMISFVFMQGHSSFVYVWVCGCVWCTWGICTHVKEHVPVCTWRPTKDLGVLFHHSSHSIGTGPVTDPGSTLVARKPPTVLGVLIIDIFCPFWELRSLCYHIKCCHSLGHPRSPLRQIPIREWVRSFCTAQWLFQRWNQMSGGGPVTFFAESNLLELMCL